MKILSDSPNIHTKYSYYLSECQKHKGRIFIAVFFSLVPLCIYLIILVLKFLIVTLMFLEFFLQQKESKYGFQPTHKYGFLVLTILVFGFAIFPIGWVLYGFYKVRKEYKSAKSLDSIEELPAKFVPFVEQRIEKIQEKLPDIYQKSLDSCEIKYYLERRDHNSIPCMIASKKVIHLILPLGFFKMLKASPETAEAILTHELGHYFHKDYRFLLIVRSFFKCGTVVNIFFIFQLLDYQYTPIKLIAVILGILYGRVMINLLRNTMERSEELADLLAIVVSGSKPVKGFLTDYLDETPTFQITFIEEKSNLRNFLGPAGWIKLNNNESLHPSARKRLYLVDWYEKNFKGNEVSSRK